MLESCALSVLVHYPAPLRGPLVFLGNHGGFSGAALWRLTAPAGTFCLKALPINSRSPAELEWIHDLMARAMAFPWMPRVMRTSAGPTSVALHGRLWEVLTWMPGQADFALAPSAARLEAVCHALAQLHQTWAAKNTAQPLLAICPAVLRRWDAWQAWHHLLQSAWRPEWKGTDPYFPLTEQLWLRLLQQIDEVPRLLAPWLLRSVPIQPCICDLWHDHVLYSGDAVTGLIDFGNVKEDHVAVDLARLLGSLAGDDAMLWQTGIAAYQRLCPLAAEEQALARDLDRTGTLLAATNWLRWLYVERRHDDRPEAVRNRLAQLLRRLQG